MYCVDKKNRNHVMVAIFLLLKIYVFYVCVGWGMPGRGDRSLCKVTNAIVTWRLCLIPVNRGELDAANLDER